MKNYLLAAFVFAVIAISGFFAYQYLEEPSLSKDEMKEQSKQLAEYVMYCFNYKPWDECKPYVTKAFLANTPDTAVEGLKKQIFSTVGKRRETKMVNQHTYKFYIKQGPDKNKTLLTFEIFGKYERRSDVKETYAVLFDKDGQAKLHAFNILGM